MSTETTVYLTGNHIGIAGTQLVKLVNETTSIMQNSMQTKNFDTLSGIFPKKNYLFL